MDLFKMMKQANQIRSKAKEMEKNLSSQKFDVQTKGVRVTANAKQDILDITVDETLFEAGREAVQKAVLAAVQEALNKGRQIMAAKTKKIMGDVDMGKMFK